MESGYFLRQQNIKRICQIYGEKLERKETSFAKNFMIDTNHRLAYCRHGKVTLSNACEIILNFYAIASHYYLNKVSQLYQCVLIFIIFGNHLTYIPSIILHFLIC